MKIAILGRTEILYNSILSLLEGGHSIELIITAKASHEYKKNEKDFENLAVANKIPFLVKSRIDDESLGLFKKSKADIVVSMNWVSVIDQNVTSIFRYGVLNAHFGDLPRFKGNAVTNWAMILGEKEITFTIHEMEPGGLDSGPVYLKRKMKITSTTTIDDINTFAQKNIPEMFYESVEKIEKENFKPIPQSETGLTDFRCWPRLPVDGKIDWKFSAVKIDTLIRSLVKPYSGAYTYYRNNDSLEKLYVWKSRIVCEKTPDVGVPGHIIANDPVTGESWIYTGDGVLALLEVSHSENGEVFAPGLKWKSIRARLGMAVEEELFELIKMNQCK